MELARGTIETDRLASQHIVKTCLPMLCENMTSFRTAVLLNITCLNTGRLLQMRLANRTVDVLVISLQDRS